MQIKNGPASKEDMEYISNLRLQQRNKCALCENELNDEMGGIILAAKTESGKDEILCLDCLETTMNKISEGKK